MKTVVILGGGPSGSTLATLLARKGIQVAIFNPAVRPELIVGESLLPAIVPILQLLGVEEEVAKFSIYKPGATVTLNEHESVTAFFKDAKGKLPPYAYNVPRNQFDQVILDKAVSEGVYLVNQTAKVIVKGDRVELEDESLAQVPFLTNQPDFIVDATGRSRYLTKKFNLEYKEGKRKDLALFAHLDKVEMEEQGNIHVDHLTEGWCWRIPLQGKTSVGIVLKADRLAKYGQTVEEQYDNFIKSEPHLKRVTANGKRLTGVMKYNNYQNETIELYGENWACVGDAAGFLDPVFSTGLYLAMKSAVMLSETLLEEDREAAFEDYQARWNWELNVWRKIIESWYNGRLFTLYRVGRKQENNPIGRLIGPHVEKHLSRIFTGDAISGGSYSRGLHAFLTKYFLLGADPSELSVH